MPASVDTKIFKKITGIAHSRVRFEPMKKSNIVQCKNCQRFSHGTRMCHYNYRCVKCNGQHDVGKCPRNENDNLPLVCVNCGGNHSANNLKECQFAKKLMASRNTNNNTSPINNAEGNNNRAKLNFNSNKKQNYNNGNNNNNINFNSSSGGSNRSWSSVVRGSANGDLGANLNVDLFREMVQSIVTQCITQLCSQ